MIDEFNTLKVVWARDKSMKGKTTGGFRRCTLEGCGGLRVGVRWPNGRLTWPCTKGITFLSERVARIGFRDEWRKRK